ncbi:MAG TPA: LysR substrate-binding domain-containing protein [Propionibacteriaceae bacterium]|nr:LysR substrate-binding domain-containing protein [Propionibacteriaceae bacterium]
MSEERPTLRIGKVPGVTVTKWSGVWAERFPRVRLEVVDVEQREQRQALVRGDVSMCFVRLPIDDDGLHLIRLYEEVPVAWVSKDHLVAAADEVRLADLADDDVLTDPTPHAIDMVSIGEAVLAVPQSVARSQSRRDFVYRPITDAPPTTVALAWLKDSDDELIQEFIGVVRGRTANSSRTARDRASRTADDRASRTAHDRASRTRRSR